MKLDLVQVPFSRFGSYFAISQLPALGGQPAGLYLRSVHGDSAYPGAMCRIEVHDHHRCVPFEIEATPMTLRLIAAQGVVTICIAEAKILRFKGEGVGVRLAMPGGTYDYAVPVRDKNWLITHFTTRTKFALMPRVGELIVQAPWQVVQAEFITADFVLDAQTGECEGVLEEFTSLYKPHPHPDDFETCLRRVEADYAQWVADSPVALPEHAPARELAAYVNWASVVAPEGHLRRYTMLSSKNWMKNVYSWDHCFSAISLAEGRPDLAWDQLMLMPDVQDETGCFPDCYNDDSFVWSYLKPPIHGWTLKCMLERHPAFESRLPEIYEPLVRWTECWLTYRDDDGDGVPQVNHGNEMVDNSTIFHHGVPVEGPDTAACLLIQMDVLSEVAARLGKVDEARSWKQRADSLLERMIEHFWQGDHFVARRLPGESIIEAESLSLLMPLMLGDRLPAEYRTPLIEQLKRPGEFLTDYGVATERVGSPLYKSDGYWRGAVWAVPTLLLVDGLMRCGENDLAREVGKRFCDNLTREMSMAEDFDSLSGRPLNDGAMTFTAAAFLLVANLLTRL